MQMAEVTALTGLPMPRWAGLDGTCPDGPGPQVRDHTQLFAAALGRMGRSGSVQQRADGRRFLERSGAVTAVPAGGRR